MYYNKNQYVSESLLISDKEHNKQHAHKKDKLNYKGYAFKSNNDFEQDVFNIKEESLKIVNPILEYRIEFISNPHIEKKIYEEEHHHNKNYGDIEFYEWLSKQTDPKVAVFAELINAPKLHYKIEEMRDKLSSVDTMSIQEYKKIKKLGARSVKIIKELKKKYGNMILKFLYLSVS